MITTAFTTHWYTSARRFTRQRLVIERAVWLLVACLLLALAAPAQADVPTEIAEMRLERTDEGVFLSTSVKFDLPAPVEDALRKGIAMYFVAESELLRDRWYWYDKRVTAIVRHMRLSYQPLTRRWRLHVAPGAISNSGLGVTLGQNFDSMEEALTTIQRISRWKVADASELEADARYSVEFRFRLDVTQLPRPFQIGAAGQPDWRIAASRTQRLSAEVTP